MNSCNIYITTKEMVYILGMCQTFLSGVTIYKSEVRYDEEKKSKISYFGNLNNDWYVRKYIDADCDRYIYLDRCEQIEMVDREIDS